MKSTFLQLLCIVIFSQLAFAEIITNPNSIVIENEVFRKEIQSSKTKPSAIFVNSLLNKNNNQELLVQKNNIAWFELVINKKLITSAMPIWQFIKYSERKMQNGGTEYTLYFEGKTDVVNGLQISIRQQIFPGSSLVREQIELSATTINYTINKLNNKIHFIFPSYTLTHDPSCRLNELQIANWGKEMIDWNKNSTFDDRKFDGGAYFNMGQCHMFHPNNIEQSITTSKEIAMKGPITFLRNNYGMDYLFSYEHASQDLAEGLNPTSEIKSFNKNVISIDELQSAATAPITSESLRYISLVVKPESKLLNISVFGERGIYFNDEIINAAHPFQSVWTSIGFVPSNQNYTIDDLQFDYLYKYISENTESRKAEFYYNTWGMQRERFKFGGDIRDCMTYDILHSEMHRASKIGADIFVIDDGWEEKQGEWIANKTRLKNGLKPLVDSITALGMKPGIWLSPMGIDSSSERYKQHRDWVLRNPDGTPTPAQWGHPAFCMTGPFYDLFLADCKNLVDNGFTFFKWDALNTFFFNTGIHLWCDDKATAQEKNERYAYLLPLYISKLMKELYEYNNKAVVEIDLTEAGRCIVGLAPLQYGKLFWMNNGASGYNDYSNYRARSMRRIMEEYYNIIPNELITYANYPHNNFPFFAQRYNVNSSLISGRGFWGNLALLNEEQMLRVKNSVDKSKLILPYVAGLKTQRINPSTNQQISTSLIFELINYKKPAGQIIAFSNNPMIYEWQNSTDLNGDSLLCILNNAYECIENKLTINFNFPASDVSRDAFIIPNLGSGISIISSTSWLDNATISNNQLKYTSGTEGTQIIRWPLKLGLPSVKSDNTVSTTFNQTKYFYLIKIISKKTSEIVLQ